MASHNSNETRRDQPEQTHLGIDAKWDACYDLTLRRTVYSSLSGAFAGLLLFRSPVTRWASIAFGAGVGIGSAYTDCSHILRDGAEPKVSIAPDVSGSSLPASQE